MTSAVNSITTAPPMPARVTANQSGMAIVSGAGVAVGAVITGLVVTGTVAIVAAVLKAEMALQAEKLLSLTARIFQ